jgi:CO/xanthine dehydrogenase Mo-binding subunit
VERAFGTIASRTAVVAGGAVARAARGVRQQVLAAAESALEIGAADLELVDGTVQARGAPNVSVELSKLAVVAAAEGRTLECRERFAPETVTYAIGVHVAEVEVDLDTGFVRVLRYAVAHDCGRLINPTIVDGQIHGGVAQGLGAALLEEIRYDESGQLQTGTLADYLVPRSVDMPRLVIRHLETPSPRNDLGIKGVGEAGAIPVGAAVANAVEDALGISGVLTTLPLTPERVLDAWVRAGPP